MELKDILLPFVTCLVILALWIIARGIRTIANSPTTAAAKPPSWVPPNANFNDLLRALRGELARTTLGRIDWTQPPEKLRQTFRLIVEQLVTSAMPLLNLIEREMLITEVLDGIQFPPQESDSQKLSVPQQ